MTLTSKSGLLLAALSLSAMELCLTSIPAQAAPFVNESFTYSAGNLSGNTPAAPSTGLGTWSGGTNPVTSGSLAYTDSAGRTLVSTGGKVTTGGNNDGAFSTFSTTAQTALNGTSPYFLSFLTSNTTGTDANGSYAGISLYSGNSEILFTGKNGGGQTTYGINAYGGNHGSTVADNNTTTHLLVTEYVPQGNGTANIYFFIDPTLGTTPDVSAAASSALGVNAFAATQVRIQGGGGAAFSFDEFRIGANYADVAPAPEPSQWASMGLGLAGVTGLALRSRRRSAAATAA